MALFLTVILQFISISHANVIYLVDISTSAILSSHSFAYISESIAEIENERSHIALHHHKYDQIILFDENIYTLPAETSPIAINMNNYQRTISADIASAIAYAFHTFDSNVFVIVHGQSQLSNRTELCSLSIQTEGTYHT